MEGASLIMSPILCHVPGALYRQIMKGYWALMLVWHISDPGSRFNVKVWCLSVLLRSASIEMAPCVERGGKL